MDKQACPAILQQNQSLICRLPIFQTFRCFPAGLWPQAAEAGNSGNTGKGLKTATPFGSSAKTTGAEPTPAPSTGPVLLGQTHPAAGHPAPESDPFVLLPEDLKGQTQGPRGVRILAGRVLTLNLGPGTVAGSLRGLVPVNEMLEIRGLAA